MNKELHEAVEVLVGKELEVVDKIEGNEIPGKERYFAIRGAFYGFSNIYGENGEHLGYAFYPSLPLLNLRFDEYLMYLRDK